MDKPKSTEWPSEDRIDAIGQNGPSGDHYEDEAFRECERRINDRDLADDLKCPSPSGIVNRMLMERCDELQEVNVNLAEENQRLLRIIGELCA